MGITREILKATRFFLGILLIIVGTAGIFLPILPGWILIFFGIDLLGFQIVFLERIKKYAMKKIVELRKSK